MGLLSSRLRDAGDLQMIHLLLGQAATARATAFLSRFVFK
jgi:hypothetical protein